jgi:hypothetical protein
MNISKINFQQQYEKEFVAVRYSVMSQSSDNKVKVEGFKKLIDFCKKAKWV